LSPGQSRGSSPKLLSRMVSTGGLSASPSCGQLPMQLLSARLQEIISQDVPTPLLSARLPLTLPVQPLVPPPLQSPTMVNVRSIEKQRQVFAAQLADTMKRTSHEIARQVQSEKQELAQRAALEKKHYDVMMDQFVQEQALAMDEQTNLEIMRLQQEAVAQKAKLEEQAVILKMEYENKKAEEDMLIRRFEIERQFLDMNGPLRADVQEIQSVMAAHGMLASARRPQDPIAPHLCGVPDVLNNWWRAHGCNTPSVATMSGVATI